MNNTEKKQIELALQLLSKERVNTTGLGAPINILKRLLEDSESKTEEQQSGNYPEDYHLENGNYWNNCTICKDKFLGYKRRVILNKSVEQSALPTAWKYLINGYDGIVLKVEDAALWMEDYSNLCVEHDRKLLTENVPELSEEQLRQLFKNNSDCYADTGEWIYNEDLVYPTSGNMIYIEGDVIQAMTEDKFIEILKQINI